MNYESRFGAGELPQGLVVEAFKLSGDQVGELVLAMRRGEWARESLDLSCGGDGEQEDLHELWEQGQVATERLIASQEGWIKKLVKMRWMDVETFGADRESLLQAGRAGVVMALKNFDPEFGALSTYATPWIRKNIDDGLEAYRSCVFMPQNGRQDMRRLWSVSAKFWRENSREVSEDELVAELGDMPEEAVRGLFAAINRRFTSLEREEVEGRDGTEARPVEQYLELNIALGDPWLLAKKERWVLEQRYFEGLTLQEVGDLLGITREGARQIESKAMKKLKMYIGAGENIYA